MISPSITLPTFVRRTTVGRALTFAEGDANLDQIRAFCLSILSVIEGSLNPDGTLVSGAVKSGSLSAGAVGLSAIDPTMPYAFLPIATDVGTLNGYAIATAGPTTGANLIASGSTYVAPPAGSSGLGTFTLSGLVVNSYYSYTQGVLPDNDAALQVNSGYSITSSGIFQATQTSVTLTGTASALVTASVATAAAVTAYKNGQIYFVWTGTANTSAATLNVNGLGAVPILQGGLPIAAGAVAANSVFCVVYRNGSFLLLAGGTSSSGSSGVTNISYNTNTTVRFTSGNMPLPGNTIALSVAHGLGQIPTAVQAYLIKTASDGTDAVVAIGDAVGLELFYVSGGNRAFTVAIDTTFVNLVQNGTPTLIAADGSTSLAITPANWKLVINATKQTSVSQAIFPALSWASSQPELAVSYGNSLLTLTHGASTGITLGAAINLVNNVVTGLTAASAGNPQYGNGAVFTRSNGSVEAIFTSNAGIYRLPVVAPYASIVPAYATYSSSGTYSLAVVSGSSYTWTKGANDTSYNIGASDVTTTPSTFTGPSSLIVILKGTPNASITASVATASSVWQPVQVLTNGSYYAYKPVWITEGSGWNAYVVPSNYGSGVAISSVPMHNISSSSDVTMASLNFTSGSINNIAPFNLWYPSGSGSRILLFQYNPLSKRIYIMGTEVSMIHIFQIGSGFSGNDISAWWASASPLASLSYIKSIAIPGIGAPLGDWNRFNHTIEVDQTTGLEKSITIVRWGDGNPSDGTITRIPWVEG